MHSHGRVPDDSSSSRAGALRPLRGARRGAARLVVGAAGAAIAGTAAHRADHRDFRARPNSAGVQRHTAVHIVDILLYVQILDVPEPGGGIHAEARHCDPRAGYRCAKLSHDRIPQRSASRRPQKGEQLVEVPTVLSYALLQQHAAEQIINISVPGRGGGGGRGGPQGFSSGQNCTALLVEQNVDTQVLRRRRF